MRNDGMEKRFVIAWKARTGERAGLGKRLMTREEADDLAAELNADYPEFEHSVAESEAEGRPIAVMPEPAIAEA